MTINRIAVIGQGYVGLPLALSFALHGCHVIGVDSDPDVCSNLKKGITAQTETYQGQSIQTILQTMLQKGTYQITDNGAEAVRRSEVIVLTVGIPIESGVPVYEYFEAACNTIGENLQKGSLILIRSTVIPGTTENFCKPIFEEKSGMKAGVDFFFAYVPERIAEGKAFEEFESMPTLIGAPDEKSFDKAAAIIRMISKADIIRSDSVMAVETSKVLENLQRDANIAIVQEFARFAEAAGMDIMEIIRLANTHKRVNLLTPGPGVGGYCIPNAFHYLNVKADELGIELPLLKLARQQNDRLPQFFADKTEELLQAAGKSIAEAKIAVAGLAMKDFSPDDRLSPAVMICNLLIRSGAKVAAYDKNVATRHPFKVDSFREAVTSADALLILNKISKDFNPLEWINEMRKPVVILDTRGIIEPEDLPEGTVFWRI